MLNHNWVVVYNGIAVFTRVRMTYAARQRVNLDRTRYDRSYMRMKARILHRPMMLGGCVLVEHAAVLWHVREALS